MDVTTAQLQDELARLRGPARVPVLIRLGRQLGMRYWQTGPGTPAGLGQLSGAIDALAEATTSWIRGIRPAGASASSSAGSRSPGTGRTAAPSPTGTPP